MTSFMTQNIKTYFLIAIASFSIISCGSNKEDELDSIEDSSSLEIDSQKISAQNVFNTISPRNVILSLKEHSGAEYNVQFLNNPDDASKYTLESTKALNFGVYGADLNIASIYDQTQESLLYFKCVGLLAKSIGVSNSFDEKMGDRMTANQENRDSTLSIISQAFNSADQTLRQNNRAGTSSLLVAGAWIEGFYVATQTAKETKSEDIIKEIFSQKESLTNLVELLKTSSISKETNYVLEDLQVILAMLNNKIDSDFSLNALNDLDKKITDLRTKIITSK
jgi:hypothetical protein